MFCNFYDVFAEQPARSEKRDAAADAVIGVDDIISST